MDIIEYRNLEDEIIREKDARLHKLRSQYVDENRKFNIGDFIGNVTGIIRVDRIGYEMFFNKVEIVYYGYRYKKNHGLISRTKDNKTHLMRESHNLKIIK